ncbi:wax ester/triacylglycerol synthase family O-acyltransferase [Sulfitobacter sp. JBTF-M27]|uniref:diacylglycerol O-acyltransferase n=1 Tax=Sulfitobacter sediminilitoris TaxID=2698830 RepID=A0A6P0CD11_9RHOB|nr:wax ester/triacylglycerol synthase family O-acyltransferase [Sulfitobacter sediminilitoris]NEK23230.1 wax ester/triacylglycerol synthase family O-acyltransferase [Sulfitobacter sediminilitoris]
MKQLSGIDATFLYMETDQTPMHVAGLTLYDLPKGFKGSFHKHFTEFFKGRVHLIPIFGMKLAKAAFELDHPGWVDAGELDFDYHIQSAKLPKPGNRKQLEDLVAELHSQRLDRTKPLWQFTIIEGLENRQAALYSKVHHAAVDGGAGMVITQALYDLSEKPREVKPAEPKPEARVPTQPERAILTVNDIMQNVVRQQLNMLETVPKMMGQLTDMIAPLLSGKVGLPQIFAPRTPFNVTVEAKRSYAARSISLLDAKAIAKATGAKLNDVVMAITSGAVRKYLMQKQQLPDAALIAFVPISMREVGNTDINNQVFGMNVPLATNYGDPLKRLKKIMQESGASKAMAGGVKDAAPSDFTIIGAPTLLPGLMQLYGNSKLADVIPQVVNMCISNNAGPPFPLYCAGAKVTALYPVSIATHGVGLNVTVQSYIDHLDFGLTCDYNAVPDVDVLAGLFIDSFEELKAAVEKSAQPAD